jgi:hypothetical protein
MPHQHPFYSSQDYHSLVSNLLILSVPNQTTSFLSPSRLAALVKKLIQTSFECLPGFGHSCPMHDVFVLGLTTLSMRLLLAAVLAIMASYVPLARNRRLAVYADCRQHRYCSLHRSIHWRHSVTEVAIVEQFRLIAALTVTITHVPWSPAILGFSPE